MLDHLEMGVLLVLLAVWVSSSDRVWNLAGRTAFLLLWVGFMAIFRGISDVVLAFELRRLGKEAEGRGDEPVGPPPHMPAHS